MPNRFPNRFIEFMRGRNGFDRLSIVLMVLALALGAFARFLPWLGIVVAPLFLYALWRAFSKNLPKRQAENYGFLRITGLSREAVLDLKFRSAQRRQYKFFSCPGCKSRLRLPRGKGKISINCPKCGLKFTGKT